MPAEPDIVAGGGPDEGEPGQRRPVRRVAGALVALAVLGGLVVTHGGPLVGRPRPGAPTPSVPAGVAPFGGPVAFPGWPAPPAPGAPVGSLLVRLRSGLQLVAYPAAGTGSTTVRSLPLTAGTAVDVTVDGRRVLLATARQGVSLAASLLGPRTALGEAAALLPAEVPDRAWASLPGNPPRVRPVRLAPGGPGPGSAVGLPSGWTLRAVRGQRLAVVTGPFRPDGSTPLAFYDLASRRLTRLSAAARYLTVGLATTVAWLDPGCPGVAPGTPCAVHFTDADDPAEVVSVPAPPGVGFQPGPAAYGSTGELAMFGLRREAGLLRRVLLSLRIFDGRDGSTPPPPQVRVVPGSTDADPAAGLVWSGTVVVFGTAAVPGETSVQPAYWSGRSEVPARRLGSPLGADLRLLCACPPR